MPLPVFVIFSAYPELFGSPDGYPDDTRVTTVLPVALLSYVYPAKPL